MNEILCPHCKSLNSHSAKINNSYACRQCKKNFEMIKCPHCQKGFIEIFKLFRILICFLDCIF